MSKKTSETVYLTSYGTPRGNSDLLNSAMIWEACRATSAATSIFDPIAVGRFGKDFVSGATGANNPVWDAWYQAQLAWGLGPLQGKFNCLVSDGTEVPLVKSFREDVLHIGETLVAIATETEQTAERFRLERAFLESTERYYRFNIVRGPRRLDWKRRGRSRRWRQRRGDTSALRRCTGRCMHARAASQAESDSLVVVFTFECS
jgi:hypothetical protein